MTTNYLVTQQTNLITFDDINITCFLKRTEEEQKTGESYTVFKKISNLAALTNENNFFNIASIVSSVEIACTLPDGANINTKDSESLDKAFGLMYKKVSDEDNKFYIEILIESDIAAASAIFNERVKSYEDVDEKSVSVFQIGSIMKTDANEEFLNNKKFSILIKEQKISNLFIKKGLDSFKEFNRKVYGCVLEG
jgi:hypothetical protein